MTLIYDLQSLASYNHDLYLHAKVQGQRSVGSEIEWKQTDRQTDGRTDSPTEAIAFSHANAVGKYQNCIHNIQRRETRFMHPTVKRNNERWYNAAKFEYSVTLERHGRPTYDSWEIRWPIVLIDYGFPLTLRRSVLLPH